jgi:hypothetical protein
MREIKVQSSRMVKPRDALGRCALIRAQLGRRGFNVSCGLNIITASLIADEIKFGFIIQ